MVDIGKEIYDKSTRQWWRQDRPRVGPFPSNLKEGDHGGEVLKYEDTPQPGHESTKIKANEED